MINTCDDESSKFLLANLTNTFYNLPVWKKYQPTIFARMNIFTH